MINLTLAAPANDQVKYLKELGVYPQTDELGLEFDDFYVALVGHLNENSTHIDQEAINCLNQLSATLKEMSDDPDLWEASNLNKKEEWSSVRCIAAKAIEKLGNVTFNEPEDGIYP